MVLFATAVFIAPWQDASAKASTSIAAIGMAEPSIVQIADPVHEHVGIRSLDWHCEPGPVCSNSVVVLEDSTADPLPRPSRKTPTANVLLGTSWSDLDERPPPRIFS